MAHFPLHVGMGIVVGLASQSSICPAAGYPVALATHVAFDDLNTDEVTTWYHGVGTGWTKWPYIVFLALASLCMCVCMYKLHLWWYVLAACLPDLEHPIRLLCKKKDYWLHNTEVMFWPPLRRQSGRLVWVVVIWSLMLLIWRQ